MMKMIVKAAALASMAAFVAGADVSPAEAQKAKQVCTNKAGQGTNTTVDGAKFQAWEAVLQAYDWSVWGAMMASKQQVGHAPGVAVRNLKSRCNPGGLGQICVVQASLCR